MVCVQLVFILFDLLCITKTMQYTKKAGMLHLNTHSHTLTLHLVDTTQKINPIIKNRIKYGQ